MEINFIQQLRRFDELSIGNLTPNAIAIYYHLFMVNNRCGWKEWFTDTDSWIGQAVGIKRRETVLNAINLLKQKGFIDYQRGGTHKPTQYKIIPLLNSPFPSAIDSAITSAFPSAIDSAIDSAIVDKNALLNSDNPKLNNKTKTKTETETINTTRARGNKPFVPPTLEQIQEYILDRGLHVGAKDFYDYFTDGGWIDAKGQKVRSWKQKLLTWERFADKTDRPQATSQEQAFKNVMAYFESEGER